MFLAVLVGPQRGLFIGSLAIGIASLVMLDFYFSPSAIGSDVMRDSPTEASSAQRTNSSASPSASSVRVVIPAQARVPTIVARFETESKEPTDQSGIRTLATAMIEDHDAKVVLEGHSDMQGGTDHNQEISLARAEWVKSRLVALGVSPNRIETVGLGATRPLRGDATQAVNRRVEVRWVGLMDNTDINVGSTHLPTATAPAVPSNRPPIQPKASAAPKASTATSSAAPSASASASAAADAAATSATPSASASASLKDLAPMRDVPPPQESNP